MDLRRDWIIRLQDWEPLRAQLSKYASPVSLDDGALPAESLLKNGLWPGIRSGPNVEGVGDETTSASREPWVDANGYWVAYARALKPSAVPLLAYAPELGNRVVPFDTAIAALVEARVMGGNWITTLEPRFRGALASGDEKALDAWKRLGATAAWLRANDALLGRPCLPMITALVEAEGPTVEIANLLFRRGGSPTLQPVDAVPPPSRQRLVVVAAGVEKPKPESAARILAHAAAGATVVTDAQGESAWWRVRGLKPAREQEDRRFFSLGQGTVVAYKQAIADPSEFALDVIDLVTHPRRAVRLWNAPAVIPVATQGGVLHLVNYGSPLDLETQVRYQGVFRTATLLAPGAKAADLKTYRRGSTTEVLVPKIDRIAIVVFS